MDKSSITQPLSRALSNCVQICYAGALWVLGGGRIGKSTSGQIQDGGRRQNRTYLNKSRLLRHGLFDFADIWYGIKTEKGWRDGRLKWQCIAKCHLFWFNTFTFSANYFFISTSSLFKYTFTFNSYYRLTGEK